MPAWLNSAAQATCSEVQLVISNPQPGDLMTPGQYVVKGQATIALAAHSRGHF